VKKLILNRSTLKDLKVRSGLKTGLARTYEIGCSGPPPVDPSLAPTTYDSSPGSAKCGGVGASVADGSGGGGVPMG
jgi:hypothetical protein